MAQILTPEKPREYRDPTIFLRLEPTYTCRHVDVRCVDVNFVSNLDDENASKEQLLRTYFNFIAAYKILVMVFVLVPYVVIRFIL